MSKSSSLSNIPIPGPLEYRVNRRGNVRCVEKEMKCWWSIALKISTGSCCLPLRSQTPLEFQQHLTGIVALKDHVRVPGDSSLSPEVSLFGCLRNMEWTSPQPAGNPIMSRTGVQNVSSVPVVNRPAKRADYSRYPSLFHVLVHSPILCLVLLASWFFIVAPPMYPVYSSTTLVPTIDLLE